MIGAAIVGVAIAQSKSRYILMIRLTIHSYAFVFFGPTGPRRYVCFMDLIFGIRNEVMIALRLATSRKKPRVPAGVRIYAVGDIHGRVICWMRYLKRIDTDLEQNPAPCPLKYILVTMLIVGLHRGRLSIDWWRGTEHFGQFFSKVTMRATLLDLRPTHLFSTNGSSSGVLRR